MNITTRIIGAIYCINGIFNPFTYVYNLLRALLFIKIRIDEADRSYPALLTSTSARALGQVGWVRDVVTGEYAFSDAAFNWSGGIPIWITREEVSNRCDKSDTLTLEAFRWNHSDLLGAIEHASAVGGDGRVKGYHFRRHGWSANTACRKVRTLQTVILPAALKNDLLADVQQWRASRADYEKHGVPYQRGYLLHGPPGSGKTSIILAIANELGLPVYTFDLNAADISDSDLMYAMCTVEPGSIILFEDIDAAFTQRSPTNAKGVSFAGLLNALDGLRAPENRILFMTTNHASLLDPALIRAGRVDRKFEFSEATEEQLQGTLLLFFPAATENEVREWTEVLSGTAPLSMARVQEIAMSTRLSESAAAAIEKARSMM